MSIPCDRCEEREATVECAECGRAFKSGNSETIATGTTALFCNQCLTVLHETLGKFASNHVAIPLALKKLKETADQELQSLERTIADNCQQRQIEQRIQDTKSSCEKLDCEIQQMVAELRQILDSREADLRSFVRQRRDQKLQLLEKQREDHSKTVEEASQLTEELGHTLQHSLEELVSLQDTLEEQLEKVKCFSTSLLHHPPSPLIRGGTACGFLVDTSLVKQALSCLLLCHEEEVSVGDRLSVAAVGGLSPQGTFWVHKVSDDQSEQVAMLQNISAAIVNELSTPPLPPLPSPHPGQLCCAQYSQDQYWYRAMIESIPKPGRAMVYFMDYGGREEVPISTLAPLPEQFQLFPFQMLHCCFSNQSTLSFSRDARWNFSDTTRNGHLSATILSTLPDKPHVPLHVVKLESVTSGEPFDIGATVVAIAEASSAPQKHHNIKYRDIRYKHIPPNPILTSSTEQSEPSNSVLTEPCEPSNSIQTEPSKPPNSVLAEPSGHPNATLNSATELNGPPIPVSTELCEPPNPDPCKPPTEPSELQAAEGGGKVEENEHVPAEAVSVEEDVTGAVESLPPDQPQPLLKSSITLPATADGRFEDAAMDHQALVEEHAGGSMQTVSCHEVADIDSTPAEDTTDQLSASHLDFGEESSHPKGAPQSAAFSNVSQEQQGEKEAQPNTATASGVPRELCREEGACSSSAEPERTGIKPEMDRKLHLDLPEAAHESGSAAPIGENLASSEDPLQSLPSFVTAGAEVEAYVTTDLSSDGLFWAQVESSREHTAMLKRLQEVVGETKGLYTPVFFSPGDLCTAQFSEDDLWYRARVESIQGEMFTVRYMDFGNVEERESGHLMSLKSDFRLLPFQAIQCSIATDDHPHFTQMELEKFDEVVPFQEPVYLKILRIVEKMAFVQILLRMKGREPLDLTEEVYTADVSTIQSMDFSLTKKRRNVSSTSFDMADLLPQGEQGMDWGERMDALQSPQEDCFLTLAGMENERSRSLTPTPLPPSHSTESEVERNKKPLLKDPPVLMHEGRGGRGGRGGAENWEETSEPNRSCVPHSPATLHTTTSRTSRLDVNMAHKQILANLDRKERRRVGGMERGGERREDREGELGAEKRERGRGRGGERRGERPREGVERSPHGPPHRPPHAHLDYGQQLVSGLIGEQWDTPEATEATFPTQRVPVAEWNHFPQSQRSMGSPTPSFATTDFAKRAFSTSQTSFFSSHRPTASPTPNWRTPWTKYTKVFVKGMPRNRTGEDVRAMFSKYGSVFEMQEHPSRTDVIYVYMDPGGAEQAINALNKKMIKGRMLVVEVSKAPSPKRYS